MSTIDQTPLEHILMRISNIRIYIAMVIIRKLFRRQFNAVLLLSVAMIMSVVACGQTAIDVPDSSRLPAEFRIGYQVVPNAELLAKNMGLIEANFPSVEIKWLAFDSGEDVNTAMVAGTIDIGLIGSIPAAIGIAQGLPYQIYSIHNIIGDNEALVVSQGSGISTLADLTGKKIGVPFGSNTHFSLLSALDRDNIPAIDVQMLDLQPQDMLAFWQRGDIDAGFIWSPTLSKLLDAGGNVLLTAKDLATEGTVTADLGIVNKDFVAAYPGLLADYVALLDKAVSFYRDDPKAAAELVAREIELSPEESLMVMDKLIWLSPDEQMSEQYLGTPKQPGELAWRLKQSAEFMMLQGMVAVVPDLDVYEAAIYTKAVANSR